MIGNLKILFFKSKKIRKRERGTFLKWIVKNGGLVVFKETSNKKKH